MSTSALAEATEAVASPPETQERPPVLDAVTRQRLAVASCAADTLESLADSGAWERLDPTLVAHLAEHARRLGGFLERVRRLPSVRACEQEMLGVRRLERRLEVALDLLIEEEKDETSETRPAGRRKPRGEDELFLGDFTDQQLSDDQREQVRERRRRKKQARRLLSPRAKRLVLYVAAGAAVTAASIFAVALGALQGTPEAANAKPPVREPMQLNPYLEDLQVFLPARLVMVQDGTAVVMVSREWLLKSSAQRQVDADGAHVFLENRAIPRIELLWEDGGLIARGERDRHVIFADGSNAALTGAAVESSGDAGAETTDEVAPSFGPGPPQ
jgi:hypothetical protein